MNKNMLADVDIFFDEDDLQINDAIEFSITNDATADWAVEKIKANKVECDRLLNVCDERIENYQMKKEIYKNRFENNTSFLKRKLVEYFDKVPHKTTKTQEQYELPTGKLILKKQNPEMQRDDVLLTQYLKFANPALVKVVESPNWGDFKKNLKITNDNQVIDSQTGQVLDFITVIPKPDVFEVKF